MGTDFERNETELLEAGTDSECAELEDCLAQCIGQAQKLSQILADERSALKLSDTVSLTDNAAKKRLCVIKLEELESLRKTIDKENRLEIAGDEPSDLRHQSQEYSHLHNSWARFIEIIGQCNTLNAGNGAVIRTRQVQVQAAINLLRSGTITPDTYDLQGQNAKSLGARSLAEA